jgi:hypothetical protein
MLNLARQPRSDGLPGEELMLCFDQPEARGTLVLRECASGLELLCPDVSPYPLAVLDFWYAASRLQSDAEALPLQIVVHSPAQTTDPMGRVQFYPQRTQVDFERGVERIDGEGIDFFYAYPLGDYPPVEQVVNHEGVQVFRTLTATWYTTDPADAGAVAAGRQFDIHDVILALQALGRRGLASDAALGDPVLLRQLLVSAIAAGIITRDGIAYWQSWPRCVSCDEIIPPDEHSHECFACGAILCSHCFSARARCPRC